MSAASSCCACAGARLRPHLKVAHSVGPEGLVPTTDRFGTALADIVVCADCGHMQTDPMPPDAELERAYAEAESRDYVAEEEGQRATARLDLEDIERFVARHGRMLDLGCWCGFLLAEARERGWQALGVEPSRFASEFARDRLGLDVRTGDLFAEPLEPGSFDAVVMGDVIEHLPRPGDALDRIASLLDPDGVLWMTLPDAGSRMARVLGRRWWSVIPTHVQYFTRPSLTTLLERHGWSRLAMRTAPKVFSAGYYLGRTEGYWPGGGRLLVRAAEATGVAQRLWAPDFRDRMAVVARPPGSG